MSIGVHNNLAMINAERQYKINTGNKAKSAEKLSTGYKINRSADDAAGLQISEKMRQQIRGLKRGTDNAQDGVSWVQTGDGALEEVHAMLHRMRELSVQSLNDTNTDEDRAALQAEFNELQSEIDRITETTQFNTQNIFDEHESPYYQCEGNVHWEQAWPHVISSGSNELIVGYREAEGDAPKTATITVPAGRYTTQELMDEIEDSIIAQGLDEEGIVVEFTKDGTCNLNLEGGEIIDSIGGGLSYLFYEMYEGGSFGALIGTTVFGNDFVKIEIGTGKNDTLSFDIEDVNGNITQKTITIPAGRYTRPQIIDALNAELANTDVTASSYGTGIKLEGTNSIVTGFKGNMFKIDSTGKVYHSVFYDNIKYANLSMTPATFIGGAVKPTTSEQEEHWKYKIDSSNNQLTFAANGEAAKTITIPDGEYTVGDMVLRLNDLFTQNDIELNASIHTDGTYQGICITSNVKGQYSAIGLDASSSAYDTLFVSRVYNSYGSVVTDYETRDDAAATRTGAKEFTGTNIPFTITAGTNDAFELVVTEDDGSTATYTITIPAGTYNTADNLAAAIKNELDNGSAGYKDRVTATATNDKIQISSVVGSGIKTINVKASGSNTGYNDIFIKTETVYSYTPTSASGTSSSPATITLPQVLDNPTTFDGTNNTLNIVQNGVTRPVTFPTNTPMTPDEIAAEISNQLKETSSTSVVTFPDVEAQGTTTTRTVYLQNTGSTSTPTPSFSSTGSSATDEGNVGQYKNNTPAEITVKKELPSTVTVDSTNNQFQITINNTTKLITLDSDTYTRSELVSYLQNKIDDAFGTTGYGSANVSLDSSNQLVFTADLLDSNGQEEDGATTNLKINVGDSTFLKGIYTEETAATASSSSALASSITITDDTNTFNFSYRENGVDKNVSLTLSSKTYTPATLVAEINNKLTGHNVKADLSSNNKLILSTVDTGDDTAIAYSTGNGGTSASVLFGNLISETTAKDTAEAQVQDTVTIAQGVDDQFNITLEKGGSPVSVTLEPGTYNSPSDFVAMLNRVFINNSLGLTATLNSSGQIVYETTEKGSDAYLKLTYSGSNCMPAIYGNATTITPGVNATINSNGQLVLTGTQNGGSLKVTPTDGSAIYEPTASTKTTQPTWTNGYTSTLLSYIDGANVSEPIKIDQYNNEFKFDYYMNGVKKEVSITVPEGDYYYADSTKGSTSIVDYLQAQIDAAVGDSNQLKVTASTNGIRIEALNPGSKYTLKNFSGDFYNKVMRGCTLMDRNQTVSNTNGTQSKDLAYAVGRKDIKSKHTEIKTGINDTLSLDFTYGGATKEFTFTLDPGTYSGDQLISEIQEKLDEQLVNAGLNAGTIEAQIGGVSTGVSGSNDGKALVFKLSSSVQLPTDGEYIIDGVSGNAAFSVFYQTEGELIPAYIKGGKDISNGVTILPGETDLSFKVDGVPYTLTFSEGEHTAQEILDDINAQLQAGGIPLGAEIEDGFLKLSYSKIGKHTITDVDGLAKDELFFSENGDKSPHKDINIQLSSNRGNAMQIERAVVNTAFLKINSVAITKPKYANKALERIDGAIDRVSEIRSVFGSEQNRLGHAIANNENTEINTQASESRIRDTDMAEEMLIYSKSAILEQASQAMQAQAKNITAGLLQLLQ